MIFCHKCGTQAQGDSLFCRKCGAKLITDNNNGSTEKPAQTASNNYAMFSDNENGVNGSVYNESKTFPTKIVVLIVVSVVILIAAGLGIVMLASKNNSENSSYSYGVSSGKQQKIELGASYSNAKNEISFNYPSDWTIDKSDLNIINIYNCTDTKYADIVLTFGKLAPSESYFVTLSDKEITELIEYAHDDDKNFNVSKISRISFGGIQSVRVDYTWTNQNDIDFKTVMYLYDTDNGSYNFVIAYRSEYVSTYTSTIDAIIDSVRITSSNS